MRRLVCHLCWSGIINVFIFVFVSLLVQIFLLLWVCKCVCDSNYCMYMYMYILRVLQVSHACILLCVCVCLCLFSLWQLSTNKKKMCFSISFCLQGLVVTWSTDLILCCQGNALFQGSTWCSALPHDLGTCLCRYGNSLRGYCKWDECVGWVLQAFFSLCLCIKLGSLPHLFTQGRLTPFQQHSATRP